MARARILVVARDPALIEQIEASITSTGHTLTGIAESIDAARVTASALQPDLLCIDIDTLNPHGGNQQARQLSSELGIPLIAVAHADDPATTAALVAIVPHACIAKPIDPAALQLAITTALAEGRQQQHEHRARERWLASVLNDTGIAAIVLDAARRATVMNAQAAALTGWHATAAQGRMLSDIVTLCDERTGSPIADPIVFISSQQQPAGLHTPIILVRRDGRQIPVSCSAVALDSTPGAHTSTLLMLYDVSAFRHANSALEHAMRTQTLLSEVSDTLADSLDYTVTLPKVARLVVDSVSDYCSILVLDKEGTLQRVAFTTSDPQKQAVISSLQPYLHHPDSAYGYYAVIRTGRSELIDEVSDAHIAASARDSHHLALMRAMAIQSTINVPLIARGRTLGAIGFATQRPRRFAKTDIALTEELARRIALAIDNSQLYSKAQRRLTELTILQNVAQIINSVTDLDTIFQHTVAQINAAFGYQHVGIYLLEEDRLELKAFVGPEWALPTIHLNEGITGRAARTGTTIFVRDVTSEPEFILRVDGTRQAIAIPFKHADGHVLGTLLILSTGDPLLTDDDVGLLSLLADQVSIALQNAQLFADLRESEARLREREKIESLAVMAGGVAHDFNNLLAVIIGNASLALQDLPPHAAARPSIEQIVAAAERGATLTQQMLAYSGRGRFMTRLYDLNSLIQICAPMLQASLPTSVDLRFDLTPHLPQVEIDPAQIQQLLMNLVTNAAEAIADEGVVTIATTTRYIDRRFLATAYLEPELPNNEYVCLQVSDTGTGMDTATLARIFEPFFSTRMVGRGLGLPAVLGIVRGHQGAIRIQSSPGQGTSVEVALPIAAPPQPMAAPPAPETPAVLSGTIVAIDDDEPVLSMVARTIERMGFEVLATTDARQALDIVAKHRDRVVCVLLDLTMPEMSGNVVLDHLQQIAPQTPIILMSGYSNEEVATRLGQARPAGIIQKPFRIAELRALIAQVIAGSGGN